MTFDMLYSKIHRATVTDANLNYVGSITIDEDLLDAAARKVEIGDKIIVIAYGSYHNDELENYKPIVVHVDEKNNIIEITNELIGSDR